MDMETNTGITLGSFDFMVRHDRLSHARFRFRRHP